MIPGFLYFYSTKKLTQSCVVTFLLLSSFLLKSQCTGLSLYATNNAVNCITSLTSATVNVTAGGTPPYTYTWLPTGGNSSVAVNISPNSYTILAKDALGCTGSTNLMIYNNTGSTITFGNTNLICFGQNNGQITANVSGATAPLSYSWTPAAPNSSVITNLSAGSYTLSVTDGLGCKTTSITTITQAASITLNVSTKSITCNGGLSGATVNIAGGVSPYTYSWSPVTGTNSVLPNIPAGNYTVTITDNVGCSQSRSVTITQPAPIQNTLTLSNVSCFSYTNGSASSNVTGGNPAYSYTWFPISIYASSVSGLAAGNYTFFVKDTKGCSLSQTFTINQPAVITTTMTHTDEFCINADGTATVNVNGGNGPYTYSWNTSPVQTNSVALNLSAGNYTVFIKDVNNCSSQAVVTIGNTSNMIASVPIITDVTCFGMCNGAATASVSGGSGPYTYNWMSVSNATNQNVSNLCTGTYTVKITDALGCYATSTVYISEPSQLSFSVSGLNTICSGSNAVLSCTATGGTPNYSFNWQPGNLSGATVTVNPTITTGYSVSVTDSNGCTSPVKNYSVYVNAPLTLSSGSGNLNVCPNVNTSITVNANGGDGNYSYTWLPGNIHSNSITVNVQSTIIYTVIISDGCGSTPVSSTVNVNVYPIANPNFTVNITKGCEPFCVQFNNLTSGTTTAQWTFGDFSPPVIGSAASHCYTKDGVYSVMLTVTNSFGCKSSVIKQNYITVYAKPLADFVQDPPVITLNDNTATFQNSSLNAINYEWSINGLHLSNANSIQHQFFEAKCYYLQLIASNGNACRDTTTREICVSEGFNFWIPNAFSPDNDGINDYFIPQGTGWMEGTYSFEILNRWGTSIFKTGDPAKSWDGKSGGAKATDDIYVWKVFVKDEQDIEHNFNGHVLIMR